MEQCDNMKTIAQNDITDYQVLFCSFGDKQTVLEFRNFISYFPITIRCFLLLKTPCYSRNVKFDEILSIGEPENNLIIKMKGGVRYYLAKTVYIETWRYIKKTKSGQR